MEGGAVLPIGQVCPEVTCRSELILRDKGGPPGLSPDVGCPTPSLSPGVGEGGS